MAPQSPGCPLQSLKGWSMSPDDPRDDAGRPQQLSWGPTALPGVCTMNFRMHFTGHVFSWEFTGVAAPACLSPAGIQLLARLPGPDALLFLVGKVPRISTFFLTIFLPVGHFPDLVQILWPHFPVVFTSLLPSLEGSYKGKRDYLQEY